MQSTCLQPHFESVFFSFHTWLSWSRVRELIWKLAWLVLWPFPQKIFSASSYQNFCSSSYNLCRNFKITNKSHTQVFKNGQPMNNACNANYSYKLVRVHIHMYRALRVQNQGLSDYHREKRRKPLGIDAKTIISSADLQLPFPTSLFSLLLLLFSFYIYNNCLSGFWIQMITIIWFTNSIRLL